MQSPSPSPSHSHSYSHSTSDQASPAHLRPTPTEARPSRSHHIAAFLPLLLTTTLIAPVATTTLVAPLLATTFLALTATPARASPPAWRWPLDGHPRILRRFTPPPERWLAGHRGVDLAAPPSTPVLAAGAGTVRFAGPVGGKGVVTIDHEGGLRTTYLPVTPAVKRGQPVTPGTELGLLQATNPHCPESCLHWGLLRDARYLNPLLLLGQAPIRLLPFWPESPQAIDPPEKPLDSTPQRPPTPLRIGSRAENSHPQPPETTRSNHYLLSNSTSPTATTIHTPTPAAITLPIAILTALLLITGLHHRRHRHNPDSQQRRTNSGRHRKRRSSTRETRNNSKH
ncbi:Murein hydrolase activator NlpD precursor [Nonomuraea coxensis DSM 45129]|uniref:Murein hydrolase activator NlpD n=1 Tax=Nonomuraea coxensis DSM 45129 TaxID=1122611 RepID=A0ABX8TVA1_9ACTN|nr:M23 family metallopeptidase [Nonomuraea coxensis]QYC39405.1 Murein hydrolase activator NlpD precursor [Nonomuraea coxensis DSM 45129]